MADGHVLGGKRVLIVGGGGGGNGRAITRAVAAAGGAVAVVDIDPERAQEAAEEIVDGGGRAVGFAADVRSADEIERVVADTVGQLGGIDVLITVVGGHGIFSPWQPLDSTTDEQWDLIFDVNLRYVFRFVRAVVRVFLQQGEGGTIVSVGSLAGVRGSPMAMAYGAAKAGLISLAKSVSTEYGRRGIRMNVVSCGLILTPAAKIGTVDGLEDVIPIGRGGNPDEVGDAVVFFASPLSSYSAGQNLVLDGGLSVRMPLKLRNTDRSMSG